MASNALPGPSSEDREPRPQAGPLPRKRGEIGYQDGMDLERDADGTSSDNASSLPARHPADIAVSPAPSGTSRTSEPSNASTLTSVPDRPSTSADASSMRKTSKHAVFLSWIDPRPVLNRIKLGGVALATILRLVIQLTLIAATIVLWVLVARKLSKDTSSSAASGGNGSESDADSNSSSSSSPLGSSAAIFVHVVFSIVTLGQLLFLERCIFLIRAQRYMHAHPGASLPTHSRSGSSTMGMAFAPWNRPSLPSYAATLAASGYGTGDVEDNIIAIPPPPAYGNTRGSTLLLAAFLRNSLRAATPQGSRPVSQVSRGERPVSYRSHDEEWEERCDAERALHLAETLERLEEAASSSRTADSGRSTH